MKAIAVRPGEPNSARLIELPRPSLNDVPDGRGVLVRLLEVGVDGTDREINAGQYGATPPGADFLVLGHEGFGVVEEVASAVTGPKPGDYVVPIVRRPGSSRYDVIGMPDMTTDDTYLEHGINLRHGFLAEYHVDCAEYLVRVPDGLRHVGVLLEPTSIVEKGIAQAYAVQDRLRIWEPRTAAVLGAGTLGLLAVLLLRLRGLDVAVYARSEPPYLNTELAEAIGARYVDARRSTISHLAQAYGPFDLVFEATGFAPLVFEAIAALAKNGVLIASGIPGGERPAELNANALVRALVLGNRAVVGTVNANRSHYEAGIRDLALAELTHPGWLSRLMTHRVHGLEHYEELFALLRNGQNAVKVVMHVSSPLE